MLFLPCLAAYNNLKTARVDFHGILHWVRHIERHEFRSQWTGEKCLASVSNRITIPLLSTPYSLVSIVTTLSLPPFHVGIFTKIRISIHIFRAGNRNGHYIAICKCLCVYLKCNSLSVSN
jgi:hypothetical protein